MTWFRRILIALAALVALIVIAGVVLVIWKPWAPQFTVDDPGPTGSRVTDRGLVANFYPTPRDARSPAVMLFSGSEGGIGPHLTRQATTLQSEGFNVLVLSWFGAPGQPQHIELIPLETFDTALAWLAEQPTVNPDRLAVFGGSKGGEAALLVAARHPELKAVVSFAPSAVPWQGFNLAEFWTINQMGSSWSEGGQPVPFLPYATENVRSAWDGYNNAWATITQDDPRVIPIERYPGRLLLQCGEQDNLWPACPMARFISERIRARGGPQVTLLEYPDAGHISVGVPFPAGAELPDMLATYGGTKEANAAAMADGWPTIVALLHEALG